MKEHPILMSTPMVQAILDGRKRMTRRIIKKQPPTRQGPLPYGFGYWTHIATLWFFPNVAPYIRIKCPYNQIGSKLWVRETFMPCAITGEEIYLYKADGELNNPLIELMEKQTWKPSIYMPHAASRITLEITDIRVERLQEITEEDAINEGVIKNDLAPYYGYKDYLNKQNDYGCGTAVQSFRSLWESINGIGSWESNQWVWVISFKRI